MKPYLLKAMIALMILFAPNILKAQPFKITGHSEIDTCGGAKFSFSVNQQDTSLSYTTYFGDGTSFSNKYFPSTYQSLHSYNSAGTYTIKHVLLHKTTRVDSVQFSLPVTTCNMVDLSVYHDKNSNCTRDADEFSALTLYVEISTANVKIDTVQLINGRAFAYLSPGVTYNFKLLAAPDIKPTCPTNGIKTVTIPNTMNYTKVDLGYEPNTATPFDLGIIKITGQYRPVDYSYLYVWAKNIGSSTGTLSVDFSPKYSVASAKPGGYTISGSTITWNVPNHEVLSPMIRLQPTTPGAVKAGDTIWARASVTPTAGDGVPSNNVKTSCDSVKASFDPNSKEVFPAGNIMPGTKLDYTIHFENLGNDTAFNIHILDTLSQYVDVNSLELTSSSHHVASSFLSGPNGRTIAKFEFANIKLADASHPESNKGVISYSVNAKQGLALGTQIENRAGIYFDINEVVMTNSATNKIDWPTNVEDVVKGKQLQVYPNPTNGVFTVKAPKTFDYIKVMNNLGQVVATQEHNGGETTINLTKLPAGMYFILVSGANGSIAEKIEKR